ncbi:MAG: hypothetical protein WC136_13220, partial [Sphaerochaeta sp.]
ATASWYSPPVATSGTTSTPDAGAYTLTLTGGSATNYSFNRNDTGTLTIEKATINGTVSIGGNALTGQVLTANISLTNAGTPTYQWKHNGTAINGANGTTYMLAASDVGTSITVTVTAGGTNYQGSITSSPLGPIQKPLGPSMSDTLVGYYPASPASPSIINLTGFSTNRTNLEASVAIDGSSFERYAAVEVDSRNRAMILPGSNVSTATKVRIRVKESSTLAPGPAQEFGLSSQDLAVGDYYQGGIVAYLFASGDPGFLTGQVHGLIAAKSDISSSKIAWSNSITTIVGTEGGIGKGLINTDKIVTSLGESAASYAAGMTRAYRGGGYSDWFLPTRDELRKMRLNYSLIGNFATPEASYYWSSSEEQLDFRDTPPYSGATVFGYEFTPNANNTVMVGYFWKTDTHFVRAVRYF